MLPFRSQLLQTFGIENEFNAVVNDTIQIQNDKDGKPFAEIITSNGRTILRVGGLSPARVPIIKVR